MIGLVGDKPMATFIKDACKTFLKEHLAIDLSEEKTHITNITKERAHFLGVDIRRKVSKATKIVSRRVKGRLIKSRINQTRIYFGIPVEKIMKKLQERGFVKTYTRPDGKAKVVHNAINK